MYKIITIAGHEYKIEYSIEASMYNDFVEKISDYVINFSTMIAKNNVKGEGVKSQNDLINLSTDAIKEMLKVQATSTPKLALYGFRAGLMEHQDISLEDSKSLYKQYLTEYHKTATDVLAEVMEKVQEDNFFAMIGLDLTKMMKTSNKSSKKRVIGKQSKKR